MSLIRYPALSLDSILNGMGISRKMRFVCDLWLGGPKYVRILRMYSGALNTVEWGIHEKAMQNVQN